MGPEYVDASGGASPGRVVMLVPVPVEKMLLARER